MSERVLIFDTTLRDGEQCPGASMNTREKLEVARQLARLRVDIIEAGFPVASEGDFEAVRAIASEIRGPRIAALARCVDADIDRAAAALEPAGDRARIHVFLATSAIHRQFKLKMAQDEILRRAVAGIQRARQYVSDVEFSPEDASRTEPEFLAQVVQAAIEAGAGTINIPDTVGYAVPHEFGELIRYLKEHVPNIARAVISVHCHNDLGLAVANSLAAIQNGARQVECTINGIGERAGNASLEEIVMALRTRKDAFGGFYTEIDTRQIYPTSRLVSHLTGMVVQRNKAIVGDNAFAHEAGIHQHGVLAHRETYEIMRAEDVGRTSELTWGKHMGHHAVARKLEEMGYKLSEAEVRKVTEQIKALADKKKAIYDEDVRALVEGQFIEVTRVWTLDYLGVMTGAIPTATVRLRRVDEETVRADAGTGDGPIDAALKTIDRITGIRGHLVDYSVTSVTRGKDAIGEVSVRVEFEGGKIVTGKATSTDIIEASALAYLNALNRYLDQQQRAPQRDLRAEPLPAV
ncbi:MAG: 2-isopropylmalate synthase [Verrucomicrobiae bacterium]|nr:2-isopropylmalate synthase [Verrucomicrobiae bacterium]